MDSGDQDVKSPSASIVLAGVADSEPYVNAEWILDKFALTFPSIPTKKHPKSETDWPGFLERVAKPRGWPSDQTKQIMIYREALSQPFLYIGELDAFRLYLKQLFNFKPSLMALELVSGYITDNRAELLREKARLEYVPPPEETWKVAIISHNHMEIPSLNFISGFGSRGIFGDEKRIELTICNSSAKYEKRHLWNWNSDAVLPYFEEEKWRLSKLKSVNFTTDIKDAVLGKNLIILLWSPRQELIDALECRTYSLREGLEREFLTLLCQDVWKEYAEILESLLLIENWTETKIVFASTRSKTPLCALASHLVQRCPGIPVQNILVNPCVIEKSYRSVIAEEVDVRTVDVVGTALWGDVGGTVFFDPSAAKVEGHKGVIEAPKHIDYYRDLLQICWDAKKLQVDFSVDALRRAHYLELLEGPRCNSLLVSETTIELLRKWYGADTPQTSKINLPDWTCVGVITTPEMWTSLASGLVMAMPVMFDADGSFQFVNQGNRDEVKAALKTSTAELCQYLAVMKASCDPDLPEPPALNLPPSALKNADVKSTGYLTQPGTISELASMVTGSVLNDKDDDSQVLEISIPVVSFAANSEQSSVEDAEQ